jgi:hypothetical protein
MQRGMMRRRMAATAIALVLGLVWAMDDPGSEGGAALSTAERDTLLTQVRVAQAELTLARDLANLRSAVAAFADVEQAAAAGYGPASDCMASERGAQGIHYANEDLFEPSVALETPQLLMYEPLADGSLRFLGVEYLVFQQAWHDAGTRGATDAPRSDLPTERDAARRAVLPAARVGGSVQPRRRVRRLEPSGRLRARHDGSALSRSRPPRGAPRETPRGPTPGLEGHPP